MRMGKKILIVLTLNIFLSLVQISFVPFLFLTKIYVNLILAFAFALLALNKTKEAYTSALLGGLLMDILGVVFIGISSFFYCTSLYIAYFIHEKFIKKYAVLFLIIPVELLYQLIILKEIKVANIFLTFTSFLFFYFVLKRVIKKDDMYKL